METTRVGGTTQILGTTTKEVVGEVIKGVVMGEATKEEEVGAAGEATRTLVIITNRVIAVAPLVTSNMEIIDQHHTMSTKAAAAAVVAMAAATMVATKGVADVFNVCISFSYFYHHFFSTSFIITSLTFVRTHSVYYRLIWILFR